MSIHDSFGVESLPDQFDEIASWTLNLKTGQTLKVKKTEWTKNYAPYLFRSGDILTIVLNENRLEFVVNNRSMGVAFNDKGI